MSEDKGEGVHVCNTELYGVVIIEHEEHGAWRATGERLQSTGFRLKRSYKINIRASSQDAKFLLYRHVKKERSNGAAEDRSRAKKEYTYGHHRISGRNQKGLQADNIEY